MRFRSLGKTTPLYALIIAACVGLFSFSVSADNMLSSDQLARAELINSVDVLSGVTNSGVSDILGVDIVPMSHDIDELSSLSGVTDTGSTNSGSTGAIVATPPIDYSTYSYYDGLFVYDGKTYGNSLYPDNMGFDKKIDGVKVYSYDEYLSRHGSMVTTDLGKKSQKSSTSAKNQKIENTMMSSSMTALAAPTNGLVAEYLLDGNANDSSGNGYHGIPTNMTWVPGKFSQAGSFNGTSSIGLIPNFGLTNQLTYSVWMNASSAQVTGTFIGINNQTIAKGAPDFQLGPISGNNKLYFSKAYIINIGSSNSLVINPNIWNHYLVAYSGGIANFYQNGINVGTVVNPQIFNSSLMAIGRNGNAYYLSGLLDNIRIYNRALSLSEIQDLYNESLTGSVSNDTNVPYLNNYFISNPTTTSSPFDNFATKSNPAILKQDADSAKTATDEKNLADPVNLATGEFGYDNILMKIPGVGLPYELTINYKNQASYNGPLGFNWDHNYNQYLTVESNGNVLYANGKLGTFRFIKNGSTFVRNEGLRANLVLSGGLYSINYDNGTRSSFNALNRISSYTDQNNNTLNFNYSGEYLSGVVDTLGRTISYTYYDHNRLRTVTDFTGRKVDFNYYTGATASGNLYDLKDIILTNSGTTKKISFEYSTGSSEPQIHNITRLIDAKGQIYVENTYDTGDRVATQKYGDGTLTYTYTLSGGLITQNIVVDKVGNRTDYTYDTSGNNTSTRYYNPAQTGSVLYGYTYSTGGLVLTETRPRGNGYRYSYDTNGNLTSKRLKANMSLADSANDIVMSYTYNTRNEKLTETLPNGAQVIYTRDGSGNILTKTQSGVIDYNGGIISGITTNYAYYSGGLQKSILTPFGRWTQFYYSSGQISKIVNYTGALTSTGSFTYSPYGTVLTATDGDGYTKTYEYSPFDLPTKQTTALGIVTTYDYDANNNKTRESRYLTGGSVMNSYFYYDSLDHLTGSLVDIAPGQTLLTTYLYDANGNVMEKKVGNGALIKYKYNEFSKVTEERIILVPGNSTEDIVTTYTYDTNNNLVSKTDPRGYIATYTYDLYDRLTRETDPQGTYRENSYNKDNTINAIGTYTSTGLILTKKSTLYDNYGHITKSIDYLVPATNTGAVEQRYTYTPDFDPSYIYHDSSDTNNRTRYDYDFLYYKRIFTYEPTGNVSTQVYNKRDLKVEDRRTVLGGGSDMLTAGYLYDGDGRLTRVTDNVGKYKSYTNDHLGYVTRTTDEIGRVTDITRDYRGLMLTSTSYSGSTPVTTTYTYDDRGNMTSITDPMNHTTSYQYDGINRNTKIIYPDLKEMIYTYDKNSNLLTKTDPNGTIVTNTYNSLNQLTNRSISLGAGVGGATSESYSYDALGRMMSGSNNIPLSYSFTYDALSRVKTETQKQLPGMTVGYVVQYNYSTVGDLTGITLPDNSIQTISYNRAHRPLSTTYGGQSISSNLYDRSFLTGTTYGNGRSTSYSYDALNRLSSINHGSGITNPTYTYNDASDILGDSTKSYTYDSLMRLISATPVATGSMSELYSYDKTGNRTTSSLSTGSTSYTTNTLDQYTTLTGSIYSGSLTYDNNGNIKTQGNRSYIYDYNNRIIQVNSGASIIATFQYDNLGRRAIKTDYTKGPNLDEATLYTYNGDNLQTESRITKFYNGSGQIVSMTLKKNYINAPGTDQVLAYEAVEQITSTGTTTTTNRYYYHTNQLGSVIAISSNTGAILQRYSYDSYGKPYIINTSSTLILLSTYTGTVYGNTRLYTGREYDRETGLYYNRARYYDSDTGRFISRDPIGQNDQVNLYAYVANSPLKYTDPSGKIIKQAIASGWNSYMNWSDKNGEWMLQTSEFLTSKNTSEVAKANIINGLENIRNINGQVQLGSLALAAFPVTTVAGTPVAIVTTGIGIGAGALETYITDDPFPVGSEITGAFTGPFVKKLGEGLGLLKNIDFNPSTMRYMGEYSEKAYGFMSKKAARIPYFINQTVEGISGWFAGNTVQSLSK